MSKKSLSKEPIEPSDILEEENDDENVEILEEEPEIIDALGQGMAVLDKVPLADDQGDLLIEEEEEEPELPTPDKDVQASGSSDLYRSFVQQAARIPRLSEEEERALGLRVRDVADEKAAKKLVLHNMRLAIKMAHQYRRAWTNLMDLVQEASTGMAIAAHKWDPDKGTRFGTYASYWIRAQLTKFLMVNGRLIHTGNTRAGRKVYFSLPQIRRRLMLQGKEATPEIIAAEVGEDPKEVAQIMARLQGREASLSAPLHDDSSSTLEDLVISGGDSPEKQHSQHEIKDLLQTIIAKFERTIENERDLAVWKEHLIAEDPVSLVDLGRRYGVSKQRMGQLATRLKRSFRRHVIEELGPHTQLSWLFNQD